MAHLLHTNEVHHATAPTEFTMAFLDLESVHLHLQEAHASLSSACTALIGLRERELLREIAPILEGVRAMSAKIEPEPRMVVHGRDVCDWYQTN